MWYVLFVYLVCSMQYAHLCSKDKHPGYLGRGHIQFRGHTSTQSAEQVKMGAYRQVAWCLTLAQNYQLCLFVCLQCWGIKPL